jgi:uncharacterized protein (DUF302 family)
MTRYLAMLLAVLGLATAKAEDMMVQRLSAHSVQVTMDNLEKLVLQKGLQVFARIDHAAGAQAAGLNLPATQLLLFGNPKAGTPLMQSNPAIGIDLPLRVLVWEDPGGKVWIGYKDPVALAALYGITEHPEVVVNMTGLLEGLTAAAGTPTVMP